MYQFFNKIGYLYICQSDVMCQILCSRLVLVSPLDVVLDNWINGYLEKSKIQIIPNNKIAYNFTDGHSQLP